MDKLVKSFGLQVKELNDEGTFKGLLSTYGNTDLTGDVILKGAFAESINQNAGEMFPLFYSHNYDNPDNALGGFKAFDTEQGVEIEARMEISDPGVRKIYKLLKDRIIRKLSVGFRVATDEMEFDDNGLRKIAKAELMEGSVVPFPANPQASVLSVKSFEELQTPKDAERCLRELGIFSNKQVQQIAFAFRQKRNEPQDSSNLSNILSELETDTKAEASDIEKITNIFEVFKCQQVLKQYSKTS